MIASENILNNDSIAADDLNQINLVLFQSFDIGDGLLDDALTGYKKDIINSFAELLKKVLFQNKELSDESKIIFINLLDKLNRKRERLEILESNTKLSDIKVASERLSKKSQSAFGFK